MGINKSQENQHCGTKPKKIAFGIAPLGIVSIGIVPMGVISIGIVPMGVFSFGTVAMGIVNLSVVGMGIISAGVTTMGIWEYSPKSQTIIIIIPNKFQIQVRKICCQIYLTLNKRLKRLLQNMDVLEPIKWVKNGCLVKCTKYFPILI